MTWTLNRILGTFIPILVAVFAVLASLIPIVPYLRTRKRKKDDISFPNTPLESQCLQVNNEQPVFLIISSVNSNNDSPCLAETISKLLVRMDDLGIELNIAPRGCATVG